MYRAHHQEAHARTWFVDGLRRFTESATSEVVIVCIGSDRSIGDALGPLTGTFLQEMGATTPIYGTLDAPVHATNLKDTLKAIAEEHGKPFIIAVDACLGRAESVGFIDVFPGSLKPGSGVNKEDLPRVGDVSITGVVNVGGFMEYFVLQNTQLGLVMKMAKSVASALYAWEQSVRPVAEAATVEEAQHDTATTALQGARRTMGTLALQGWEAVHFRWQVRA